MYQYLVFDLDNVGSGAIKQWHATINTHAAGGWRVMATVPIQGRTRFILEREVER